MMIPFLRKRFDGLVRNEQGNVIILVGIMAFLLILSVGVAVDMARAQILQQRISAALDAAGLAAMATLGDAPSGTTPSAWVKQQTNRYFSADFPTGYLGSTTISPSATLNDPTDDTLTLSATTSQSTTFMQAFGINQMNVSTNSQVTRSSNGTVVELVLVLDNTGSMACDVSNPNTTGQGCSITSTSKITALQSAATSLVNQLLTTGVTTVYIGIVPFSQAVNVGSVQVGSWMDPADPNPKTNTSSWPPTNPNGPWQGCVNARPAPYNTTDDTPATQPFQTYWFPPQQAQNNNYNPFISPSPVSTCMTNCAVGGSSSSYCNNVCNTIDFDISNAWRFNSDTGPNGPFYNDPTPGTYSYSWYVLNGVQDGPNELCPQVVTPLTSNKDDLIAAINAMTPVGDTLLDQGMVWGWRMLSPNWRGLWNQNDMLTNSLPNDYNASGVQKYVVLITDGSDHFGQGNYTAYGFLSQGQLGSSFTDDPVTASELLNAETTVDNNFLSVCNALGGHNVTIYTVGFGPNSPDNPLTQTDRDDGYLDGNLLAACAAASPTGFYYAAPSNTLLDQAFSDIVNQIENVRVSK